MKTKNIYRTEKLLVYLAQIIIAMFLYIFRFLIVRSNLRFDKNILSLNNLPKDSKLIVYSNHQSIFDPFIITASMPFNIIYRLLPFRFFVENT